MVRWSVFYQIGSESFSVLIAMSWIRVRGEAVAGPQTKYRLEALRTIARPLGTRARGVRVEHALAREAEIETLSNLLADTRQNILIVGPAGAGKTTLLQSAVRQWMQQKQTHAGGRKDDQGAAGDRRLSEAGEPVMPAGVSRMWGTSAGAIIAGMQYLGEWEERLQEAIEELSQFGGVLCIDSFIELVRLGGRGAADSLAAFMRSFVMRGELRIVAETTAESLDAIRRLLPGWAECFQIVKLQPLDARGTKRVVERIFQFGKANRTLVIDNVPRQTAVLGK